MDTAAFMAEIKKIPPVTRFLAGSSLAVTLPVILNLVSPYKIFYAWSLVYGRLEVWRIWTSFFFGGSGINFLFDLIMLYASRYVFPTIQLLDTPFSHASRTSDALESQNYTWHSADYAWQLSLAAIALIGLNHPLGSHLHHRPLLLTLVYLSSRLSPQTPFSLFGLVTVPAMWWPYVMIGFDFLTGGTKLLSQSLTGIVVGHAWWLLAWRDGAARPQSPWMRAPEWLQRFLPPPRTPGASGPQPRRVDPRGGTATTDGGHRWGAGQRLGDQ